MKLIPNKYGEKAIYAASMALSRWVNGGKNLKACNFQNILVFKLDEIGDLVYSLHVFDLLKQRYPKAKVTLLCKPYCVSLVNSHPSIDCIFTDIEALNETYDLIVDLRGNWQTIWYALTHKPKARLDRGTVRYQNKKSGGHPHEVITNTQIITPLLLEIPEIPKPRMFVSGKAVEKVKQFLAEKGIHKFAVLHAGARKELRRWPAKSFASLAIWLKQTHQLDCIFTGDASDNNLVQTLQKEIPFETYNTCSLFDLTEFGALVQQAALYVGNESGPLCISSISGTPSLGLFGPGEPIVFYPYGKHTAYIHHVLECNPCDQIHCVHPDNTCMQRIGLDEVKIKINGLISPL